MKVLCAPNAFKGSLTALEAARAMARGVRRAGATPVVMPVADGGDGTAETIAAGIKTAERVSMMATGPYGGQLEVHYWRSSMFAFVDVAQVGLARTRRRDPMNASSVGVGQMIRHALWHGARMVVVALGGSATVDGGAGMLRGLGMEWIDEKGVPWRAGGPPVDPRKLVRFRWKDLLEERSLLGLYDVRTRLPECARLFGPQKGASPRDVRRLSRRLALLARHGAREARRPGSGAAGGIGWALALLGGRLMPGAKFVLRRGFDEALRQSDLVLTGEGRWDATTAQGKAPWEVMRRARLAGVPCLALCGSVASPTRNVRAIAPSAKAGLRRPAALLEQAAFEACGAR